MQFYTFISREIRKFTILEQISTFHFSNFVDSQPISMNEKTKIIGSNSAFRSNLLKIYWMLFFNRFDPKYLQEILKNAKKWNLTWTLASITLEQNFGFWWLNARLKAMVRSNERFIFQNFWNKHKKVLGKKPKKSKWNFAVFSIFWPNRALDKNIFNHDFEA